MIAPASRILNVDGKPFRRQPSPRPQLAEAMQAAQPVRATYDAARTTDEHKNYWANADHYDADSANSRAVRETLVSRSRYEIGSSGYSDGIAATYATDIVGKGPSLRMMSGSQGFNQMVEAEFARWAKAVQLRRKLWCSAHAKHTDGEGMGVMRYNPGVKHPLPLDVRLYETEQFQTPELLWNDGYVDGMETDEYGNITFYHLMRHHPGATTYRRLDYKPERIPVEFVLHWFKMRRPGQHRGIPDCSSTLNTGAAGRRWREAVIGAAENIASFSLFLKTAFQPEQMDEVEPMSTTDIQRRMMTALPAGFEAFQPRAEQPTANHSDFNRSIISEQARPKSMPYNKAACDSSGHNFASGKLDHLPYNAVLDNDRDDCEDTFLEPMFNVWFRLAVVRFGWLGGDPGALSPQASAHEWDWPRHKVFDIKAEAQSDDTRLKNGSASLASIATSNGQDYEDTLISQAQSSGLSVEEQRKYNLLINTPQHAIPAVERMLGLEASTPADNPQGEPQDETEGDADNGEAQDD